jgi:hypothetical protein
LFFPTGLRRDLIVLALGEVEDFSGAHDQPSAGAAGAGANIKDNN